MLKRDKIIETLAQVNDPELHRSLTELKMVRESWDKPGQG